jgi:ubiquitin thioesterase protein OTUB1
VVWSFALGSKSGGDEGMDTEAGGEEDRPRDDEILAFHNLIRAADAEKLEFVGDKEPLSVLAAEYASGSPVFKAKVEKLGQTYVAIRRARGDGNCFFRSFMFSYLEHLLVTQDEVEVARVERSIEECKKTLIDLGHAEFTFEDFLVVRSLAMELKVILGMLNTSLTFI